MRHGDISDRRPTAVPDFWRDVTLTGRCDVTELCFGLCNLCFDATAVVRNLQLSLELGELKPVSIIFDSPREVPIHPLFHCIANHSFQCHHISID